MDPESAANEAGTKKGRLLRSVTGVPDGPLGPLADLLIKPRVLDGPSSLLLAGARAKLCIRL